MIPELELLYNESMASRELVRWLMDEELIHEYRQNERSSSEKQEELLEVLEGKNLALFQHFLDSMLNRTDAECQIGRASCRERVSWDV